MASSIPVVVQRDDRSGNETPSEGERLLLSLLGVVSNAPPYALDFLACRDRLQVPAVSRTVRRHLRQVEYHRCKDGRLYKVPFPGYTGLLDQTVGDGLFPHQLASLQAMHRAENRNTDFGSLRGGILGDAPGLGKSITMLALIALTAGQRPKVPPPDEDYNGQEMQEGWRDLSQNPSRNQDMIRCLKAFRRLGPIHKRLLHDVWIPFPLQRYPNLEHFERTIRRTARANGASDIELEEFRKNVMMLKATLVKSKRKILMSERGRRQAWERSLVPACSTLVIVPDALLEHWCQQTSQHLNRKMFADATDESGEGRGVVYLDGVGDIADARMPLGRVKKQPMLKPWELARYTIVVTTFSRCEEEFRIETGYEGNRKRKKASNEIVDTGSTEFHSSLLNIRWLRVVVDEGHELGSHEGGTSLARFVHELAAERRWVMSGTPVVGDLDDSQFSAKALDQMQRLLVYLRHPVYGDLPLEPVQRSMYVNGSQSHNRNGTKQAAKRAWAVRVKEPFLAKIKEGREELLNVLRHVAVLHRKEDINLPKPQFEFAEVDIPLPATVQVIIQNSKKSAEKLLSQYLRTDDFQELVDKAQGTFILESIARARKELQARGGALEVSEQGIPMRMWSQEDFNESSGDDRRPIKAVVYSSNSFNLRDVTEALYSKLSFENIAEAYDDPRFDPGAEVSRFRHNRREIRTCPTCGYLNDYEGTATHNRNSRCQNLLLEVVKRGDEGVRFLVEGERVIRAVPPALGGNVGIPRLRGDYSTYNQNRKAWREGDILEVNITDPHHVLKRRENRKQWQSYGADKCIELAEKDNYTGQDWFFGPLPSEEDSRTIEVVLQKWQRCGKFHSPRWYTGPRVADAPVQSIKEDTFILALDAGLAHGLDLSFVTHIFLLESIDDAALLEQVTSRAHRLGATGPVTVCTVNTFYTLDPTTEMAVVASHSSTQKSHDMLQQQSNSTGKKKSASGKAVALQSNQKNQLTKVVCQYCYRNFDTMEDAVTHENTQCPRNPTNFTASDPWHISSVYRELRPPPPHATEGGTRRD